jgi:NAD+---dinitrogen-reductase ADP-D-ribosyltransferase
VSDEAAPRCRVWSPDDGCSGGAAPRPTGPNRVGVPAAVLASVAFNRQPRPLHIDGARAAHADFFAALACSADVDAAHALFAQHVARIGRSLPVGAGSIVETAAARARPPHRRLLHGWGFDASGPAGAVLKAWAESRFGLGPSFHGTVLGPAPSAGWAAYRAACAAHRAPDDPVFHELDLVYEFCQWMLQRHQLLGAAPCVTLWRGSSQCEEQLVAGQLRDRRGVVRLNNLVSFSRSREQAGCFGDWVLQAQVPQCKLVVVPGVLPPPVLQGECEVLAVGGDYEVTLRHDG